MLDFLAGVDPGLTDFLTHANSTSTELDAIAAKAYDFYNGDLGHLEDGHMREAVQVYADSMMEALCAGAAPLPPLRSVT